MHVRQTLNPSRSGSRPSPVFLQVVDDTAMPRLAIPMDSHHSWPMRFLSVPAVHRTLWCAALAAAVTGCGKFGKSADLEFRSTTVVRTNVVQSVSSNGAINPTRLVQVGSQVSGTIVDLKVDFNSKVKEGDVVAKIDPASFERALARADADLAATKAQQSLATFNLKRAKDLFNSKLISETEYMQTDVAMQEADANVKMREAAVDSCRVDLQRTTIYAPINGIVIQRNIEIGQTVASSFSTPTLITIADDLTRMQIELAVSEADIGSVEVGQRVDFSVDAFPNRKFTGQVNQVRFAPTTNQNVVTYTTVVSVSNPDMHLRPGMTATASVVTSERTNVLSLPGAALRFTPPATGVKVLAAAGSGTNSATAGAAPNGPNGFPEPPWRTGGERRRPTDEERKKFVDSLNAEQREAYNKFTEQMRQRMAEGGGGGAGGGGGGGSGPRPARADGPTIRTVYVLEPQTGDDKAKPALRAVTVRLGVTDGSNYEVLSGIKEGDVVITGVKGGSIPEPGMTRSPLSGGGSPFGGGGRPPGR